MRISEAIELLQRANLPADTEVVMEFHDIEDVAHRLDVTTESLEPLWSQVVERWNHSSHDLLTPLADIALTVASEQGVTLTPEDV